MYKTVSEEDRDLAGTIFAKILPWRAIFVHDNFSQSDRKIYVKQQKKMDKIRHDERVK